MTPLPKYRPKQLSLGPLESELLNIIWDSTRISATDIHDRILADPDREFASNKRVGLLVTKRDALSIGIP
jgi:predicted transcriptional regulator